MDKSDQIISNVVKKSTWYARLPKWLRVLLLIASIVTIFYWICFCVYWILKFIQIIGSFIFDKNHYWVFLITIILSTLTMLIIAQICGFNPFGKMFDFFKDKFEWIRETIGGLISGK